MLSLPWIEGYIRGHEHRSSRLWGKTYDYENALVAGDILEVCEERNLPVLEFWVDQVCLSTPGQRKFYLSELRKKLPSWAYAEIQDSIEERSSKSAGHLDRWGILRRFSGPLRSVRSYLSR